MLNILEYATVDMMYITSDNRRSILRLSEQVDIYVKEKRFVRAVEQLRDGIDTLKGEDFCRINAFSWVSSQLKKKYEVTDTCEHCSPCWLLLYCLWLSGYSYRKIAIFISRA